MKTFTPKRRYFILLFILLITIVHHVIHFNKDLAIDNYLNEKTILMSQKFHVIYKHNEETADLVFKTLINKKEILKLFKAKKRDELHTKLLESYTELKAFNIRQLHFHLPNNDSFLRMHRPSKFGDNLSRDRLTVKYVNENKSYINGFEEGKIFNGFRYVYPLFDDKEHIGSVEISFSALSFIKHIQDSYKIRSNFLIDKKVVNLKIFKEEHSNYVESPLERYYFQKSILKYTKQNFKDRVVSNIEKKHIYNSIDRGKAFSIYDDIFKEIVTLIPIRNPISKKIVAVLTFRSPDTIILKESQNARIIFVITLLLICLFLFALRKELKHKNELEQKVDDRTSELLLLNKKLEEMAHIDPLTGSYNRRHFYEVSKEILAISKREKNSLSLAMIDIDKFKDINDNYGHDIGDEVLKILVKEIKKTIRESDIFIRYGGEEFLVIFANTNIKQALVVSQKVRKVIESCVAVEDIRFTISIGVSEFKNESDDIETLLKRADVALYAAKNSGRNRVNSL